MTSAATEGSANSIINVKTVDFEFWTTKRFVSSFTEYLVNVVLPYLKQVLPSTVIWTWEVKSRETIDVVSGDVATADVSIRADGVAFNVGEEAEDYNITDDDKYPDFIANYDVNKWIEHEDEETNNNE